MVDIVSAVEYCCCRYWRQGQRWCGKSCLHIWPWVQQAPGKGTGWQLESGDCTLMHSTIWNWGFLYIFMSLVNIWDSIYNILSNLFKIQFSSHEPKSATFSCFFIHIIPQFLVPPSAFMAYNRTAFFFLLLCDVLFCPSIFTTSGILLLQFWHSVWTYPPPYNPETCLQCTIARTQLFISFKKINVMAHLLPTAGSYSLRSKILKMVCEGNTH